MYSVADGNIGDAIPSAGVVEMIGAVAPLKTTSQPIVADELKLTILILMNP